MYGRWPRTIPCTLVLHCLGCIGVTGKLCTVECTIAQWHFLSTLNWIIQNYVISPKVMFSRGVSQILYTTSLRMHTHTTYMHTNTLLSPSFKYTQMTFAIQNDFCYTKRETYERTWKLCSRHGAYYRLTLTHTYYLHDGGSMYAACGNVLKSIGMYLVLNAKYHVVFSLKGSPCLSL